MPTSSHRCSFAAGALLVVALALSAPALPRKGAGQQARVGPVETMRTNVVLDTNPSLFAVLAAINVGGYDAGLNAPHASPLRAKLRDQLLAKNLPIYGELRMFYAAHREADSAADLAQYISLGLLLGDPPNFKLNLPLQDMPPDAARVAGLVPLLQRFYADANLAEVWQQYKPVYEQAIDRYAPQVRRVLQQVDLYFRLPQAYLGRQFVILPEFLASPVETHARNYMENYFIVVPLDVGSQIDDIRHTYLHYVLDPLVAKYPDIVERTRPVLPLVARAPALDKQFKSNLRLFYTECLVRAVEARLTPMPGATAAARAAAREKLVRQDVDEGFVLTQFFFDSLQDYDRDVLNFSEFYPQAGYMMDIGHEEGQARHIRFAAAPPHPEPAQPQPLMSLLEAGEQRLAAGDFEGVTTLAAGALADPNGDHPTAYFLMAEVAAREGRPEMAQKYFERALATAPLTAAHVRTWSNIYLARILDLEQKRDEAVAHYRAALATADTSASRSIALEGIRQPFTTGRAHAAPNPKSP